jgi:transcriptional regulator with XRE-family HTH domain
MAKEMTNERDAIFAEEAFVVEVQGLLHQIMEEKGFTRADLARALNVSRPRITQIFSDECKNLTVRLLARAMHAMGESPELTCGLHMTELRRKWELECRQIADMASNVFPLSEYETDESEWILSANDNGLTPYFEMAA